MTINCVWEHNGRDTLLYAVDFVGAYTRGETLEAAVRKMQAVLQIKVNRFCRKSPKKYSADSRVKMRTANRTPSKIGGSQMTK